MSMREAILNFNKQFEFEPQVENADRLAVKQAFIVAGMGGSHLAADIIQTIDPSMHVIVDSDYDISLLPEDVLKNSLAIASSYSGNTEETVSALNQAIAMGLDSAAISVGGKIAEIAKEREIPYIRVPDTGIQPRSALGFSVKAMLKMTGREDLLQELSGLASSLSPSDLEDEGKKLAETLKGKVPVIYSSATNKSIAYNWKIKFNETGKIPAFYNVVPELNHNEMTGFDAKESSAKLSENFHFIFLKDDSDHPQNLKRMEVMEKLYADRGFPVSVLELRGSSKIEKIFSSLVLADWAAYHTAEIYGLESEQVPMVEEFKKLVS